jgi:ornithine decarboxylase
VPSRPVLGELPVQWPARLYPDRLAGLAFQTPYRAGDVTVVADRMIEFGEAMRGIDPYYAVKANPAPEVISTLAGLGAGFQAGSSAELNLLIEQEIEGARVLLGSTVKPGSQLRAAAEQQVWRMAFDSEAELLRIAEHAPGSGVYLRLNVSPGQGRPLGAPPVQARPLMARARDLGLVPYGLAFHLGTQQAFPSAWRPALGLTGRVMSDLLEDGVGLALLDLGGGFPARYAPDPPDAPDEVPISEFGREIRQAVDELLPYRPDTLICEPGRFLVAESAVLVTTVLDRSHRDGADWLTLDAGVHQGLADGRRFPVTTSMPDEVGAVLLPFGLAGPTCDPNDVIARAVHLPSGIQPGDLVMFGCSGAYTEAAGYNGFAPPKTFFV